MMNMKSKIVKGMGILIVVSMILMSVPVNADDPEPIPLMAQQQGGDSTSTPYNPHGGLIETTTPIRYLEQYQSNGKLVDKFININNDYEIA